MRQNVFPPSRRILDGRHPKTQQHALLENKTSVEIRLDSAPVARERRERSKSIANIPASTK